MNHPSVGIWGTSQIHVEYDFVNLLPRGSYMRAWIDRNAADFPSDGAAVTIYTQEITYTVEDFEKIDAIVGELDNMTETETWILYGDKELRKNVQTPWEAAAGFWWPDLKEFICNHEATKDWREALLRGRFPAYLSDFLNHEEGSIYKNSFR